METANLQAASPHAGSSKYLTLIIVVAIWLLLLPLIVLVGLAVFYFSFAAIHSEGSAELAAEWSNEMIIWEIPADANDDQFLSIYEFADGEWAIVKSRNSHSGIFGGGGTVVVKDSNGMMNTFHRGHVCGDGNPLIDYEKCDNLASFYDEFSRAEFKEFEIP